MLNKNDGAAWLEKLENVIIVFAELYFGNRSINKKVKRSTCRKFQTDGQNSHPWAQGYSMEDCHRLAGCVQNG